MDLTHYLGGGGAGGPDFQSNFRHLQLSKYHGGWVPPIPTHVHLLNRGCTPICPSRSALSIKCGNAAKCVWSIAVAFISANRIPPVDTTSPNLWNRWMIPSSASFSRALFFFYMLMLLKMLKIFEHSKYVLTENLHFNFKCLFPATCKIIQ